MTRLMPDLKGQSLHGIRTRGEKVFAVINVLILSMLALVCVLPFWYIFCVSVSESSAVVAGQVSFFPVKPTLEAYSYILNKEPFWSSMVVTLKRVALGIPLSLFIMIMSAYPLSKDKLRFRARGVYVWYFFLTMLFNGGMIPTYLVVNQLRLLDTIWALVLPCTVNVFNMLLLLSFFRQVPGELEDAAFVDGASHWTILWKIYVPISLPVLATVTLFTTVMHWNSWFDGLIYMNNPENYPLQTYLRSIIIEFNMSNMTAEEQKRLAQMSAKTIKCAQMFIGALPILMVYPFLQKYFVSGITLGSVKG